MSSTKLRKAPLKEVVFEIHWDGEVGNSGVMEDPGFEKAQGKLDERLKSEYPVRKKLYPDNGFFKIFGAPIHQYWKGQLQWPVIQHGQCILTVNEIESGYEWEKLFKPTIKSSIVHLFKSYEEQLNINRIKLQYIDAFDVESNKAYDFMKENLLTAIQTQYKLPGTQKNFNILQSFDLSDGSEMQLSISNGINSENQKSAIIWTTTVEKIHKFNKEEVDDWLDKAHDHASNMFKTMLNPEFYASLDR